MKKTWQISYDAESTMWVLTFPDGSHDRFTKFGKAKENMIKGAKATRAAWLRNDWVITWDIDPVKLYQTDIMSITMEGYRTRDRLKPIQLMIEPELHKLGVDHAGRHGYKSFSSFVSDLLERNVRAA